MASVLIVLIILGCAAYLYLKGTFVRAFATVIITICASIVAFGYFELLANVFISRIILVTWAQPLCFLLLFILTFAILQTIAIQLTHQPVDLGTLAERIGRVVCGLLSGLIISGLLLTVLAIAPLSNSIPYQRFDAYKPDTEKPNKALFNADGFATGWFSIISRGSFSGKRSFAALHPNFLDQLFLNRHGIANDIPIITRSKAIEVPKKKAVWPAPEALKDSDGNPLSPKSKHNLTFVRVGIKRAAFIDARVFTPSQLRLVCKEKSDAKKPLAGKGKNIYPIGYLKTADQLQIKQLNEQIKIGQIDFDGNVMWLDFAFYVPNDFLPVLVEFKQNNIALLPPPVTYEQAPPAMPFITLAKCATDFAELQPISSARVHGIELAAMTKLLADLELVVSDPNQWQSLQTTRSIKPAQFEEGRITCVRAELKIENKSETTKKKSRKQRRALREMLKPLDGYRLLSLKCNNPSIGTAIKAEQLPVLVEQSGLIHHPVGVIASGQVGEQTIYQVDYCSLTAEQTAEGLVIAEDGSVTQPFPDTVWLTEQAESISQFYVLYLVKSGRNAIITSVQPADSQTAAAFKGYEGFSVK